MDTNSNLNIIENPTLELLTAIEAANLLKVSSKTVYLMMQQGEIPTVLFGRSVRIRRQDLNNFIKLHLFMDEAIRRDREWKEQHYDERPGGI